MPVSRLEMVTFAFHLRAERDRNAGGTGAKSEREKAAVEQDTFVRLKQKAAAKFAAAGCLKWQGYFVVSR
jgi:hypothetical protein